MIHRFSQFAFQMWMFWKELPFVRCFPVEDYINMTVDEAAVEEQISKRNRSLQVHHFEFRRAHGFLPMKYIMWKLRILLCISFEY